MKPLAIEKLHSGGRRAWEKLPNLERPMSKPLSRASEEARSPFEPVPVSLGRQQAIGERFEDQSGAVWLGQTANAAHKGERQPLQVPLASSLGTGVIASDAKRLLNACAIFRLCDREVPLKSPDCPFPVHGLQENGHLLVGHLVEVSTSLSFLYLLGHLLAPFEQAQRRSIGPNCQGIF
jgi:hypothetical protein